MESRRSFLASILILVLFTIALQSFYFIGMTGQYGEEAMFIQWALDGLNAAVSYSDLFRPLRTVVTDWEHFQGDPSGMYAFRVVALYPNSLFVKWFGASEVVVCLWTLITGILTIPVLVAIGERLQGRRAGIISGIILALTPGRLIYTSRIDTDMPQLFVLSVVMYCLVRSYQAPTTRQISGWAFATGVLVGTLYLAKLTLGLFTLVAIVGLSVLTALRCRFAKAEDPQRCHQPLLVCLLIVIGFSIVFSIENITYFILSGHWLLHWHMMHGNSINIPVWRSEQFTDFWFIRLWWSPEGVAWLTEHSRVLLKNLSMSIYNMNLHGLIGWAALVLGALALIFRGYGKNRGLTSMVLWGFALYYLYNEIFWYYPTIEKGLFNLTPIHKVHRFIFPCYLGGALLAGIGTARAADCLSRHLPTRRNWLEGGVIAFVTVVYALGSVNSTKTIIPQLRFSYEHFRSVGSFLRREVPQMSKVFFPAFTSNLLMVAAWPTPYKWAQLAPQQPLAQLCGGWAVVVNHFGVGTSTEGVARLYPPELAQFVSDASVPPDGWRVVWSDSSGSWGNFRRVASVSKLPECETSTSAPRGE